MKENSKIIKSGFIKVTILLSKLQIFFLLSNRYQSEAKRQRERRLKLKEGISKICEENKEAVSLLRSFNRKEHGRPRIEYDQPGLLSTIVKILEASSATDDRRRMECLRTVTILDDLHSELKNLGFSLSRSTSASS